MINKKKKWSCLNEVKDHLVNVQKEKLIDFNGWRLEMEDACYYMFLGELRVEEKPVIITKKKKAP